MKVINCEPLKSDSLINIGDTYIVVSIGETDDINKDSNTIGSSNNINENENDVNKCVTDNNFSLRLKIYSGQLKIEPR